MFLKEGDGSYEQKNLGKSPGKVGNREKLNCGATVYYIYRLLLVNTACS